MGLLVASIMKAVSRDVDIGLPYWLADKRAFSHSRERRSKDPVKTTVPIVEVIVISESS